MLVLNNAYAFIETALSISELFTITSSHINLHFIFYLIEIIIVSI